MSHFTAIYDACVLYPAPIRDHLLQLARTDLFRAKWTQRIHEEGIRNLLMNRPDLNRDQLERTRNLIDAHMRDCLVEEFEDLETMVELPDSIDRHVVAAAFKGRADVIVTNNLKDFPVSVLKRWHLEAQHPDEFVTHLTDLAPEAVCASEKACRARLQNPTYPVDRYLDVLAQLQLQDSVAFLKRHRELI